MVHAVMGGSCGGGGAASFGTVHGGIAIPGRVIAIGPTTANGTGQGLFNDTGELAGKVVGHRPLVFVGGAGVGKWRAALPCLNAPKRIIGIVMAGDLLRALLREDVFEGMAKVLTKVFKCGVESAGMGDGGEHVGQTGIAHVVTAERIDKGIEATVCVTSGLNGDTARRFAGDLAVGIVIGPRDGVFIPGSIKFRDASD